MHLVFVYGTLKAGHGNHRLLQEGRAEYIGEDFAPGIVYGPFPYAKPPCLAARQLGIAEGTHSCGDDRWIRGEVYKVDDKTLARLDSLEGHPRYYRRTNVVLRSGREAGIYYLVHELQSNAEPCFVGEPGITEWSGLTR